MGVLTACTAVGVDRSANFDSVSVGDSRATVLAKMGSPAAAHESASVLGVAYRRDTYVDLKNQYAVVFFGDTAVVKFSNPRQSSGITSCQ